MNRVYSVYHLDSDSSEIEVLYLKWPNPAQYGELIVFPSPYKSISGVDHSNSLDVSNQEFSKEDFEGFVTEFFVDDKNKELVICESQGLVLEELFAPTRQNDQP